MKEGWEIKKLTDVCHIQYGYAFDSLCFCDDDSYPQLIRIRDVVRGYSETFYNGNIPEGYFVYKDDYLIGMDGEFHIAQWQSEKALLNQRVCKISATDCDVDERFIYYTMSVVLKQIEDETPFVTVKHLSAKRLNLVKIPIPPLSEQSRIVEELDQLSNIIEKKRQQLSELDNLAQSIFYDMFGDPVTNEKGWEVKKLGEVCIIERGGSPRPISAFITNEDNGVNWIKIGDAEEGSMYINSTKEKIKPEGVKKSRMVHKGDFILSNSMSFGKPYILGVDGCIHDGWLVIRDINRVFDKSYLYYYLGSKFIYNEFKRLAVGGVVNNLNSELVRGVLVAIPPLNLQQLFAQKIEAIEKEKELIKQSIKETEILYLSRMNFYFK